MAQVLYGSILGDVKDASGASVPGAAVVVTNNSTGLTRQGVTDGTGRYTLSDLPAGIYSLKASVQGFKTFERTEVTVSINSVSRIDVTLEIGSIGLAPPPGLNATPAFNGGSAGFDGVLRGSTWFGSPTQHPLRTFARPRRTEPRRTEPRRTEPRRTEPRRTPQNLVEPRRTS
jgi:hypothetical protein